MDLIEFSALIMFMAFVCEYVDSSLGMGYGTTLTPILLLMGYSPLQIVPAILLSELVTGITAGFFHHQFKNVNFKIGGRDLKSALVIAACSIFGTLTAVILATNLPAFYIKLYIGILIFSMGILILATLKKTYGFSWKKIISLGLIAAFNKGISGGGYGPVVTSGQILSGVKSKSAIGITSLAEGLTCFVGVVTYLIFSDHQIQWNLAPSLVIGALLSVPLAAYTVKSFKGNYLKLIIGIVSLLLGLLTLGKIIF